MLDAEKYKDLLAKIQSLDDASLVRLVHLSRDDYTPEALGIAEDEIRNRGLENIGLDDLAQKSPEEYYQYVAEFCPHCIEQTIAENAGDLFSFAGFGVAFVGGRSECEQCGSVIQRKWVILFNIPLIPLTKYRVKYVSGGFFNSKFIGRKLKPSSYPKK